jgi:hypothetical protein
MLLNASPPSPPPPLQPLSRYWGLMSTNLFGSKVFLNPNFTLIPTVQFVFRYIHSLSRNICHLITHSLFCIHFSVVIPVIIQGHSGPKLLMLLNVHLCSLSQGSNFLLSQEYCSSPSIWGSLSLSCYRYFLSGLKSILGPSANLILFLSLYIKYFAGVFNDRMRIRKIKHKSGINPTKIFTGMCNPGHGYGFCRVRVRVGVLAPVGYPCHSLIPNVESYIPWVL